MAPSHTNTPTPLLNTVGWERLHNKAEVLGKKGEVGVSQRLRILGWVPVSSLKIRE